MIGPKRYRTLGQTGSHLGVAAAQSELWGDPSRRCSRTREQPDLAVAVTGALLEAADAQVVVEPMS